MCGNKGTRHQTKSDQTVVSPSKNVRHNEM